MKKILTVLTGFLLLILFAPTPASAVEYGTFTTEANGDFIVGPTKSNLVVAPGETIVQKIKVQSRIDGIQNFEITAKDFVAAQDRSEVVRFLNEGDVSSPYPLSDYISVDINKFSLGLGETLTFDVTISVPADAAPGGRYGAIIISALPDIESGAGGAGVAFYTEIGSLLLVRVDGPLDEYGYVDQFTVNGEEGGVFFEKPLDFEILFQNEGNVHLVPYGQISISNMYGNPVGAIGIDAYFALPDSVRYRSFSWPEENLFLLGRYTAELELYPGYRDVPEIQTLTFWYVPIWAIVIFVGSIFLLSLMHTYIKRTFTRRKKEQ